MFHIVLGFILGLVSFTASANSRALIGVVNLTYHAKKAHLFYRLEEKHAATVIRRKTNNHYDSVKILTDENATLDNFLFELKKAKENPTITKIDVVFYIHGQTITSVYGRALCFYGEPCMKIEAVEEKIKKVEAPLGVLYSDACWGGEHMPYMISAGFEAVAGSVEMDANQTGDLKRFLKAWVRGESFQEAIDFANRNPLTPIKDSLVKNSDSFKLTLGQVSTTISDF